MCDSALRLLCKSVGDIGHKGEEKRWLMSCERAAPKSNSLWFLSESYLTHGRADHVGRSEATMIRPLSPSPLRFVRTRQHRRRRRCANARLARSPARLCLKGNCATLCSRMDGGAAVRPDTHGLREYTTNRQMPGVYARLNRDAAVKRQ